MPPTDAELAECREWLARVVDVDCRSGLYDEANILAALEEIIGLTLGEPNRPLFDEHAARVRAGLAAQAALEATWGERTANDRLDSAFDDLNARGIVAGQALGFTTQEGWARIVELGSQRPSTPRGGVFYHRQDLERALVDGQGLMLAFGGWLDGNEESAREVGRELMHVLGHHGVAASWNGSEQTRIALAPFRWEKRRTTTAPPGPPHAPPLARPKPPERCPLCNGRGFIEATDPRKFPGRCACQRTPPGETAGRSGSSSPS